MIICIEQTASSIKQEYDVHIEDNYYFVHSGRVFKQQPIIMQRKDQKIIGKWKMTNILNLIPFRYLFGVPSLQRCFNVVMNNRQVANIIYSHLGYRKTFYVISLPTDTALHCYGVSKGDFNYVCIYQGETQIALIETYLTTVDWKYKQKIYLIDGYNGLAEVFAFFAVYYLNYNYCRRFHMSKGSFYKKQWTFSKYNDKYDPSWRELHFPNEDFFGGTGLSE